MRAAAHLSGLVELFDVRCLIEGMAARPACDKIDDALIASLETINTGGACAARRGHGGRYPDHHDYLLEQAPPPTSDPFAPLELIGADG
jgi:DNA-binding GntR family transcriptional regulator